MADIKLVIELHMIGNKPIKKAYSTKLKEKNNYQDNEQRWKIYRRKKHEMRQL